MYVLERIDESNGIRSTEHVQHDDVDAGAHDGDNDLRVVHVHKGTRKVGHHAFHACSRLKAATLPPGITKIGNSAFRSTCLEYVVVPLGVTELGARAFADTPLEHVNLPPGLVDTGRSAFSRTQLVLVMLPSTVTIVGDECYRGCRRLRSVAFGPAVMRIGAGAFRGCVNLDLAMAPLARCTRMVSEHAFDGCTSVTSAVVPEMCRELGAHAFAHCTALRYARVGDHVRYLREGTFSGCTALDQIDMGDAIEQIGKACFRGCPLRKGVVLPRKLVAIRAHAFRESGINALDLPATTTLIGEQAFEGCHALADVTFPAQRWRGGIATLSVGHAAFAHTSVAALVVPAGTCLGRGAFQHSHLAHLRLEGLGDLELCVRVPRHAFYGCRLETLTLPAGCPHVCAHAFGNNARLRRVWLRGRTTMDVHAFDGCHALTHVVAPAEWHDYVRVALPNVAVGTIKGGTFWSTASHHYADRPVRDAVHSIMLAHSRQRKARAQPLARVPPEIILLCLSFFTVVQKE